MLIALYSTSINEENSICRHSLKGWTTLKIIVYLFTHSNTRIIYYSIYIYYSVFEPPDNSLALEGGPN